jgi:hypothetical protein
MVVHSVQMIQRVVTTELLLSLQVATDEMKFPLAPSYSGCVYWLALLDQTVVTVIPGAVMDLQ